MKPIVMLLACGLAAVQAQETPKSLYAHVDFVDIQPGKAADYHKSLKDDVLPKLQERLKSGDDYAFVNYSRQFPHGTSVPGTEIRIMLSRHMKGAEKSVTAGILPGLFHTASGELWRMRHAVNLEKFLQSPVVRVLLLRYREGRTNNDTINIYKNGEASKRAAETNGLVIFDRLFPGGGGSGDYTMAVLWGYTDIDQIEAGYEQAFGAQRSPEQALDIEKLRQVRDVVRMELWRRRSEFVLPQ
jgi:hypothetical protein